MSRSRCTPLMTRSILRHFPDAGAGLALAFLTALVVLPGCGDSRDNCPQAELRYGCVGWIAPDCGYHCYKKGTNEMLLSDCCGSGGSKPGLMPTAPGIGQSEIPVDTTTPPASQRPGAEAGPQVWRPRFVPRHGMSGTD